MINVDKSGKNVCEKDYIWNPATCSFENGKYFTSIMDDSAIACDEIIESYEEETKTISINFDEKKATCKRENFYILLLFLLITIGLLIAVRILTEIKRFIYYSTTQRTN